jgi:DNA-binding NtrC family response regulator
LKILLVDDDTELRLIYRSVLELQGYEVHTAGDGLTAMTLLQLQSYALVITDINMPRMNGLILLSQMKDKFPKTPVIIMTGVAMKQEMDAARRFGAFAVLAKPFPLPVLVSTVALALALLKQ